MLRAAVLLLCVIFFHATPAHAQNPFGVDTTRLPPLIVPSWAGTFSILGANTLIGAATGGVIQKLRGGSFRDGFTRGALGGLVQYAGKRISVASVNGAGLVGRQVGAFGASIVRNASEARPTLETLVFPLGPVRFYVRTGAAARVSARLDVASLAWAAYSVAEPELVIDGPASASAGTLVFKTRNKYLRQKGGDTDAGGFAPASMVLLSDVASLGAANRERAFAHERVHVVQEDWILTTLTAPAAALLLHRVPGGDTIERYADFNVSTDVLRVLTRFFPDYSDRPWEFEAEYLARR